MTQNHLKRNNNLNNIRRQINRRQPNTPNIIINNIRRRTLTNTRDRCHLTRLNRQYPTLNLRTRPNNRLTRAGQRQLITLLGLMNSTRRRMPTQFTLRPQHTVTRTTITSNRNNVDINITIPNTSQPRNLHRLLTMNPSILGQNNARTTKGTQRNFSTTPFTFSHNNRRTIPKFTNNGNSRHSPTLNHT